MTEYQSGIRKDFARIPGMEGAFHHKHLKQLIISKNNTNLLQLQNVSSGKNLGYTSGRVLWNNFI